MSDNTQEVPHDHGPHQHAHPVPTTQQIRTVGQRRRDSEEKLEHHLDEARHKSERRGAELIANQIDPEPDHHRASQGED